MATRMSGPKPSLFIHLGSLGRMHQLVADFFTAPASTRLRELAGLHLGAQRPSTVSG